MADKKNNIHLEDKKSSNIVINDNFLDIPIHLLLLSLGLLYGGYYIFCLLNRLSNLTSYYPANIVDIMLIKKVYVYGHLFPLSIILTGFLTYLVRISFSKINFLRFISFYVTVTLILYFILAYLMIFIGFGGLGSAKIFFFKPFLIFWNLLVCIPTKYTMISLTFYALWTLLIFITTNTTSYLKTSYSINQKLFFIVVFILVSVCIYLSWGNAVGMTTIIILLTFSIYFPFDYKNKKITLSPQKAVFVIFIFATFLPVLYSYLGHSEFLLNFAYR